MTREPTAATHLAGQAEAPFDFDELFFSRTDRRGIIESGNEVFQRVSMFAWDELLQRPHKIIRHPDMPRGVFHVFWDYLRAGKPIGAYVKNRAKDGRHYWVFAIATPVENGYLSVRLKPGSPLRAVVEEEYQALRAHELAEHPSPEASAARLLDRLRAHGFPSYDAFMSAAIAEELAARGVQLGHRADPALASFRNLLQSSLHIVSEAENIVAAYEASRFVPLNLQVLSAQLGDDGRAIAVISEQYGAVSGQILSEMATMRATAAQVIETIYSGNFLTCVARVQREVASAFELEPLRSGRDRSQDTALLADQCARYGVQADEGLRSIQRILRHFQSDCQRMNKLASSLEVIRVIGKVNAATLTVRNDELSGLMNDLRQFQESIAHSLRKVEEINRNMDYAARAVVAALSAA